MSWNPAPLNAEAAEWQPPPARANGVGQGLPAATFGANPMSGSVWGNPAAPTSGVGQVNGGGKHGNVATWAGGSLPPPPGNHTSGVPAAGAAPSEHAYFHSQHNNNHGRQRGRHNRSGQHRPPRGNRHHKQSGNRGNGSRYQQQRRRGNGGHNGHAHGSNSSNNNSGGGGNVHHRHGGANNNSKGSGGGGGSNRGNHSSNANANGIARASGWAQVHEGDMDRAEDSVEELVANGVTPNEVTTFNMLAYGWVQKGDMARAQGVVESMVAKGVRPNRVTFNTLVDGWVKRGDMARAEGVVEAMIERGVKPNKVTFNTLADGWVKAGDMNRAQGVVDSMVEKGLTPDAVTFNTLMDGWLKKGAMDRAQSVVDAMVDKDVAPDLVTYETLIFGNMKLRNIEAALGVFGSLRRAGISPVTRTFNYFIFYYSQRAFASRKAFEWFERMLDAGAAPNDHTWTSFHKRHHSYLEKARALYARRKAAGWRPRSRSNRSQKKGNGRVNNGHANSHSYTNGGGNSGGDRHHAGNNANAPTTEGQEAVAVAQSADGGSAPGLPTRSVVGNQRANPEGSFEVKSHTPGQGVPGGGSDGHAGTYPRNLYRNFFKIVQNPDGSGSSSTRTEGEDTASSTEAGANADRSSSGSADGSPARSNVHPDMEPRHGGNNGREWRGSDSLPEGYVCKICNIPGHHIRNCPNKTHRRQNSGGDGTVWIPCSHIGMRRCRVGQLCNNPSCGFAHPSSWPHHQHARAAPGATSGGQGKNVAPMRRLDEPTGVVWVAGYQFGMRRCRDGMRCQRVFCGFAHPEGWQDFRNSGGGAAERSHPGSSRNGAGGGIALQPGSSFAEQGPRSGKSHGLANDHTTQGGHGHRNPGAHASQGRNRGHPHGDPEEYHRRAVALAEETAPDSVMLAHELTGLARCLQAKGDYRGALTEHRRALAIRQAKPPEDQSPTAMAQWSAAVASSLNMVANALQGLGLLQEALAHHREALRTTESAAPSSLSVAHTLNQMGDVFEALGDRAAAIDHHRQALAVREARDTGGRLLGMVKTLQRLAALLEADGQLEEAAKFAARAAAVQASRHQHHQGSHQHRRQHNGHQHPGTQRTARQQQQPQQQQLTAPDGNVHPSQFSDSADTKTASGTVRTRVDPKLVEQVQSEQRAWIGWLRLSGQYDRVHTTDPAAYDAAVVARFVARLEEGPSKKWFLMACRLVEARTQPEANTSLDATNASVAAPTADDLIPSDGSLFTMSLPSGDSSLLNSGSLPHWQEWSQPHSTNASKSTTPDPQYAADMMKLFAESKKTQ